MKLTIPTLRKLISEDIKKIINEAVGETPPAEPKKNVSYKGDYSLVEIGAVGDDPLLERWQRLAGLLK